MPSGSVRLHSIKKLGQDNNAYDVTDEPTSYMTMTSSPKDDKAKGKAEQPAIRIGFFQLPLMLLVFGMLTDAFIDYDIELNELSDPRKECVNNTIRWRRSHAWTQLQATFADATAWTNSSNSTAWDALRPLGNRSCG
ncbi:hypothetical protein CRUP_012851 [Coryphaenoides rupestris]|nr:hypothetical protein CRUP_024331 [Coryphaenoides rupestris]KAG7247719.1 hypothetical protein CRUP_012851 [Coryphaenoides rupestris]